MGRPLRPVPADQLDEPNERPDTVDLDYNENPLGTSPLAVREVIRRAGELHRYPRLARARAVAAVTRRYGVEPDAVLLTAGVDEAVDLLLQWAGAGWCFAPGFNGYRNRAAALRIPMRVLALGPAWEVPEPLGPVPPGVGFVARPGNPTGALVPPDRLEELIRRSTLACIDETYLDFAGAPSLLARLSELPGACVFLSFSKAWGLAGLRIGALFGPPSLIAELASFQRFHSVDSLSLHVLAATLQDDDFHRRVVAHVLAWRPVVADLLRTAEPLFPEVVETEGNWVLARCAGPEAGPLVRELAAEGVRVLDCAAHDLPGWVRVTAGSQRDLHHLERALAAVMARTPRECEAGHHEVRPPDISAYDGPVQRSRSTLGDGS